MFLFSTSFLSFLLVYQEKERAQLNVTPDYLSCTANASKDAGDIVPEDMISELQNLFLKGVSTNAHCKLSQGSGDSEHMPLCLQMCWGFTQRD